MGGHETVELNGVKAAGLAFRIATLGLSVAAAVVMGTASQCTVDEHGANHTVSYSDYNAFIYFVAANSISAMCSALTVYLSVYKTTSEGCSWSLAGSPVAVLDVFTQGILFSVGGAAFSARNDDVGRPCVAGGGFYWKVDTAATVCVCAAAAASVAVLAGGERARPSVSCGSGGGSSSCACRHGCQR